jgi:hypothetical protein
MPRCFKPLTVAADPDRYSGSAVRRMCRPMFYRLQSIQTRPPTNPSNAARRIDADPMTAPVPPLPDWVAPIRDRKKCRREPEGRTGRQSIESPSRSQSERRNQPQSGSATGSSASPAGDHRSARLPKPVTVAVSGQRVGEPTRSAPLGPCQCVVTRLIRGRIWSNRQRATSRRRGSREHARAIVAPVEYPGGQWRTLRER